MKRKLLVALLLLLVAGAYALASRNYRECRRAGFSRGYCAANHLIR